MNTQEEVQKVITASKRPPRSKIIERDYKDLVIEMRKKRVCWNDISAYLQFKGIDVDAMAICGIHARWMHRTQADALKGVPSEVIDVLNQHKDAIFKNRVAGKPWHQITGHLESETGIKISRVYVMRYAKALAKDLCV